MQILNLRLIYIFFLHSLLCLFFANELLHTALGNFLLGGSALFWLGRTIEQFIYSRQLPFKNPVNRTLTLMFIAGTIIYAIPLLG